MSVFRRKRRQVDDPMQQLANPHVRDFLGASMTGRGFTKAVQMGQPLTSDLWVNAAATGDPWDEGAHVVEAMDRQAGQWPLVVLETKVKPLLLAVQDIQQARHDEMSTEELESSLSSLGRIEAALTGYLRADMWSGIKGARLIAPDWAFHYGWAESDGLDTEEPVLYSWMRKPLQDFERWLSMTEDGRRLTWGGALKLAFEVMVHDRRAQLLKAAEERAKDLPD